MAKGAPAKDPRFRRFRTAAYGLYIAVVSVFSVLLIYSIFRSVLQMSPRPPRGVEKQLTPRECVDALEGLWRRLDDQRRTFTDHHPARGVDAEFSRFRIGWMKDLRDLQARCAVDSRNRKALRSLFHTLENVQARYMTHAVQFAGEVGPEIDQLQEDFRAARNEAQGR
ncbi:MAG: hypothetical protein IRZ16_18790 [Myxococcaceae bacterium]|nr:hypothetical protein [Myxococcaceae bacterium]